MKNIVKRFIEYVKIDTQSAHNCDVVPSTKKQFDLAYKLEEELKALGVSNVRVDEHACVMGVLKSNLEPGESAPAIGFISHMDTSPDCSGTDVKPQIFENYDGGEIVINEKENIRISQKTNEELKDYIGHTIITSDGTTLLGADNKAGIAIIMNSVEYLVNHPEVKHGDMCIAFTPDEEVAGGAHIFDIEGFGADFAFTVDGSGLGEFNHETFHAYSASVEIKGVCIHPGAAYGKMINPVVLASEFISAIPRSEMPETTKDREGFYYLHDVSADESVAKINLIIRDFDAEKMQERLNFLQSLVDELNKKYQDELASIQIKHQYPNMNDVIKQNQHIIDNAIKAYELCDITPNIVAIRGGTDGSTLSLRGLPTPNIFVGAHNFHSVTEYASVETMEKASEVLIKILELYIQSK